MKILYVYHENIDDPNMMSGTVSSIYKMLVDLGHEVIILSDLKFPFLVRAYNKIKHTIVHKTNIGLNMDKHRLKSYSRQIRRRAKDIDYDLVFCPLSSYYAYFSDEKPTVFFIDSNIGCLVDYYWSANDYLKSDIKTGFDLEERALRNTTLAVYASNWARDSAIKYHNGDPSKIVAINRGANIRHTYGKNQIAEFIKKRNICKRNGKVQLLFLGKDWKRKGGTIACAVVGELNKIGIDAKLIVIGCTPEIPAENKNYVEVLGFMDKNNPNDYEKIDNAYSSSDFFILPTQAEAQGISYIEACAWGTPPIGCITGGVGDVVIEGVTGFQLPTDAAPSEYAARIRYYIDNPAEYERLANSAFDYYQKNMTWHAVGTRIFEEISKRI